MAIAQNSRHGHISVSHRHRALPDSCLRLLMRQPLASLPLFALRSLAFTPRAPWARGGGGEVRAHLHQEVGAVRGAVGVRVGAAAAAASGPRPAAMA
eukprot:82933-Pyramimonas_sp.AAC.1